MSDPIFHPEAKREFFESIEFYEGRCEGLGARFFDAVHEAVRRYEEKPRVHGFYAGTAARKHVMKGFPFNCTTSSATQGS